MCTYAQKSISEATLIYTISTHSASKTPQADPLAGATNTVYLKGSFSRTDMSSALGKETTIMDSKTGTGVILKEYSGQKLMITLSKENWITQNKKFEGVNFVVTAETKKVAGYNCIKATASLNDGSLLVVYYTTDIITINKTYDPTFKNLQGLPVEYEFDNGKLQFKYLLTTVDQASIALTKFDYPKTGFRIMTYEENRLGKKEGQ